MDIEKYIASGILELYVAGALNEEQNLEVQHYTLEYPEIQKEIEAIENTLLKLTKAVSPGLPENHFDQITNAMDEVRTLEPKETKNRMPWFTYVGWAASILLAVGLLWMYNQNSLLKSEVEVVNQEKQSLEEQIVDAKNEIISTEQLLNQLRDQNVSVIALGGQSAAPESFAKAYWNKAEQKVFIDAQGLPEPPEGYTYQVWSLKLDPLTPTSIGLLDDFKEKDDLVFELPNPNESEAFGITLEPEGGSESPTLEQLYTLGAVGA
jgi:anti-sigma-K factor RskA